jgi:hypothetical protein
MPALAPGERPLLDDADADVGVEELFAASAVEVDVEEDEGLCRLVRELVDVRVAGVDVMAVPAAVVDWAYSDGEPPVLVMTKPPPSTRFAAFA